MFRLCVCVAMSGVAAFAGWPRQLGSGSSPGVDYPTPHPIAYFRGDPCMRSSADAIWRELSCAYQGSGDGPQYWAEAQAELVEIGTIGRFRIYELYYDRMRGPYPGYGMRSVLVKVGKNLYREINVALIIRRESFPSSEIVNLEGEPILIVKSHDGGNNPYIYETLYMFRPDGLATPDFKAVGEAVAKLMRPKMSPFIETNDYPEETYTLELYRNDTGLPRVSVAERGRITVTYRFVDGRAVVKNSKYEAYTQ